MPYLYDLDANHTPGRLFLESIHGDMLILSWLYSRAAFWLLDRDGIKGRYGENLLKAAAEDEDEEDGEPEPPKGIGALDVPDRFIYCLDLRDRDNHRPFVEEVLRIAAECRQRREVQQQEAGRSRPSRSWWNWSTRTLSAEARKNRGVRSGTVAATARPALVSRHRLQPLHQLHGVHRFLPIWRLWRGWAGANPGRESGRMQKRLSSLQPSLPRTGDHFSGIQDGSSHCRGALVEARIPIVSKST